MYKSKTLNGQIIKDCGLGYEKYKEQNMRAKSARGVTPIFEAVSRGFRGTALQMRRHMNALGPDTAVPERRAREAPPFSAPGVTHRRRRGEGKRAVEKSLSQSGNLPAGI